MESLGSQFAGESRTLPKPLLRDQRRAVRQKAHTPAYVSLQGAPDDSILDLCEILDISERGALLQTPKGWELGSALDLLLDFSETQTKVRTKGEVVWTDAGGRVGVRFPDLSEEARRKLQEWLFLNVMVAAANHSVGVVPPAAVAPAAVEAPPMPAFDEPIEVMSVEEATTVRDSAILDLPAGLEEPEILELEQVPEPEPLVRSDYTTTLSMLAAVQREVEGLAAMPDAAFQLVAERVRALTSATGAAVAVDDGLQIVCRGSAGNAPPTGAPLDRSSGISGRCVKTGLLQRCDDSERDTRVDRDSCRDLGIRSILAVPVRLGTEVTGIVEVFSSHAYAFGDLDAAVLQRLSESVQAVANRKTRTSNTKTDAKKWPPPASSPLSLSSSDAPAFVSVENVLSDMDMGFLRKHLIVLVSTAVLILGAVAYVVVPRIGRHSTNIPESTLSAESPAVQPPEAATPLPTIDQIRERAEQGDPHSQFTLGTHYALGEDVPQDYAIASRWFLKAAEQGIVLAQDTLGAYYWAGRGVPKDIVKAYFWSSVAKQGGNSASQVRVQFLTPQLTRDQAAAIQRQAAEFVRQHPPANTENRH